MYVIGPWKDVKPAVSKSALCVAKVGRLCRLRSDLDFPA